MEKIAVFAGTFDPFTRGHQDIAMRALALFDKIVVAIGKHAGKATLFSLERRRAIIRDTFSSEPRIEVADYDGLTIDFCRERGAHFIIRGLRSGTDFDYERTIAQANSMVNPSIETIFFVTRQTHAPIASTVVRDLLRYKVDASAFLPEGIDITKYL